MKSVNFTDKVFTFTDNNQLFSAPCRLIVAVSGGPDSMALLHALRHWPQSGLELVVAHMHHGLRGATADRDEDFVRSYCATHNLPFFVFKEDVARYAKEHKLSLEEAGRVLRYRHFEQLRVSQNADWIVTAHTASDQIETMLMHLARGCGLDALCGIPAKRDRVCRPLLTCTRQEVIDYCHDNEIPYVLDESNQDTYYTRNRVRHDVLPLLRQLNPNFDTALLRFQSHIAEDVEYLNQEAHSLLSSAKDSNGLQVDPLADAPLPIRRRAIRMLLKQQLTTVEEVHILAVEHLLLSREGTALLPGKVTAKVSSGYLRIQQATEAIPQEAIYLEITQFPATFAACGKQYTVSVVDSTTTDNVHNLFANPPLDYDTMQGGLIVRTRRVGDTLQPAGRGVTKTIKKLMNEWKLPLELRDYYPLLCDDNGVVLVPGYACDQRAVVTSQTKRYLVIQSQE